MFRKPKIALFKIVRKMAWLEDILLKLKSLSKGGKKCTWTKKR